MKYITNKQTQEVSFMRIFSLLIILVSCLIASYHQYSCTIRTLYYYRNGAREKDRRGSYPCLVRAVETKKGALSNTYGFYSLSIPASYVAKPLTLRVTYIGFKTYERTNTPKGNMKLDIELEEDRKATEEVVVTAEKGGKIIESAQTGVEILDVKAINKLPVVFGERDVLKTIQLIPGVKTVGEGNGGLYVRGGGTDPKPHPTR